MPRKHHYRRRAKAPVELDVTTFLNLMVVLVPFLLITAVFSRITIVELSLPSAAAGSSPSKPSLAIEVVVREAGVEITNGRSVIAQVPKIDGDYDLDTLSKLMLSLKRDHPEKEDASVLLEPHIEYDHLIRVMDVVQSAALPETAEGPEATQEPAEARPTRVALFPNISIGDAP